MGRLMGSNGETNRGTDIETDGGLMGQEDLIVIGGLMW